mgnify:CR=1 FL=1
MVNWKSKYLAMKLKYINAKFKGGAEIAEEEINECPECGDHLEFEDTDYFCEECGLHFDKCEECKVLFKEGAHGKSCWNCSLSFCFGCNPELQNDELWLFQERKL